MEVLRRNNKEEIIIKYNLLSIYGNQELLYLNMCNLSEGDLVNAILQRKKVSPDRSLATEPSIIVGT